VTAPKLFYTRVRVLMTTATRFPFLRIGSGPRTVLSFSEWDEGLLITSMATPASLAGGAWFSILMILGTD
jgi:hypothetical protein